MIETENFKNNKPRDEFYWLLRKTVYV